MMFNSPCKQSTVLGTRIVLEPAGMPSSPSLHKTMGCAFLAVICANADWTLGYSESWVMMMMTGMFSSTNARGPCLSSPARIPNGNIYHLVEDLHKTKNIQRTFRMHIADFLNLQSTFQARSVPKLRNRRRQRIFSSEDRIYAHWYPRPISNKLLFCETVAASCCNWLSSSRTFLICPGRA